MGMESDAAGQTRVGEALSGAGIDPCGDLRLHPLQGHPLRRRLPGRLHPRGTWSRDVYTGQSLRGSKPCDALRGIVSVASTIVRQVPRSMREQAEVQAASARAVPPARRRDRRADIMSAALHEFAANGYSGARIERIAAGAGVDDRLIYYYFGSKEALY